MLCTRLGNSSLAKLGAEKAGPRAANECRSKSPDFPHLVASVSRFVPFAIDIGGREKTNRIALFSIRKSCGRLGGRAGRAAKAQAIHNAHIHADVLAGTSPQYANLSQRGAGWPAVASVHTAGCLPRAAQRRCGGVGMVAKRPVSEFRGRDLRWARFQRDLWEETRVERQQAKVSQLDDSLFEALAHLARVPQKASAHRLRQGICYEVDVVNRYWPLRARRLSTQTLDDKRRTAIELRRLAKCSRELSALVCNLKNPTLTFLWNADCVLIQRRTSVQVAGKVTARVAPDPGPTEEDWLRTRWSNLRNSVAEVASFSAEALRIYKRPSPSRPSGRPPHGQFSMPVAVSLVQFTFFLLLEVRDAGGRLTINKNAGRGSLLDALALLRPHLPRNFIPRSPPLSTLARVVALDRKTAAIGSSGT